MEGLSAAAELAAPWIFGAVLIFVRVVGLLSAIPFIGTENLPMRVRVVFAIALTAAFDAGLGVVALTVPDGITMVLLVVRELLIGLGLGLIIRTILAAFEGAGALAGIQMGLSLNILFDVPGGQQTVALGRLFSLAAVLMFFALGGHILMVKTFFVHLERFPVGESTFLIPSMDALADAGVSLIGTAVLLAAPVIVVTLILNMLMGFLMRVVPSLNIFGIGLGIMLIGGFVALGSVGETLLVWLARELELLPEQMFRFVG